MFQIGFRNFPDVSNEDRIVLSHSEPMDRSKRRITLATANGISSIKAIELWRGVRKVRSVVGPTADASFDIEVSELADHRLVFAKGKFFNVLSGMYEIRDLSLLDRDVSFHWERDTHNNGPVAGFFSDIGNAVDNITQPVFNAVDTVIGEVSGFVSGILEGVGTFLANVCDSLDSFIFGVGTKGPFHWLGTILSSLFSFAASVVKVALIIVIAVAVSVATGQSLPTLIKYLAVGYGLLFSAKILNGLVISVLRWDAKPLLAALGETIAVPFGGSTLIVGNASSLFNSIFFMQLGERPLTTVEHALLERIFRRSVQLYNVRVIDGFAGVFEIPSFFGVSRNPFVLGNKIYMKGHATSPPPGETYEGTLVHESVHVWQYQHGGGRYISDSIWAYSTGEPADWAEELNRGTVRTFEDLSSETQAFFVEEVYFTGQRSQKISQTVRGEFFDEEPLSPNAWFRQKSFTEFAHIGTNYIRSI
jgi:hypothetical protein